MSSLMVLWGGMDMHMLDQVRTLWNKIAAIDN